jgi:hypothetical protein
MVETADVTEWMAQVTQQLQTVPTELCTGVWGVQESAFTCF